MPLHARPIFLATAALLATVLLAAGARAADMPRFPLPDFEKPSRDVEEFVSGWYLRGDIAYSRQRATVDGVPTGTTPVGGRTAVDKFAGGIGAGYKYGFLRADVTLDYADRSRTFNALFNGYIDFGTWYGITPYIGAGIGSTRTNPTDFRQLAPSAGIGPSDFGGRDSWRFSWAWMGGVSYQFMPNWLVDVGYRYVKMGDSAIGLDSAGNTVVTFRNPNAHEFRVGLRFMID